jgi:hypothetical protein
MSINDEYERMWTEAIVMYFKTEIYNLVLNTNHKNPPRTVDFQAEN